MKHRNRIGWFAVLTAVGILWFFGESLAVYLFPRLALSKAVERSSVQLWEEYAKSPVYVLSQMFAQVDGYCLSVNLSQEHLSLGRIEYDLTASLQDKPRILYTQGTLQLMERKIDLSAYLDKQSAALTSEALVAGKWYGFRLDSLCQEIRGHSALNYLLGGENIAKLEDSLARLKTLLNRDLPAIPLIHREDMEFVRVGLMMLDYTVISDDTAPGRRFFLRSEIAGRDVSEMMKSSGGELPEWAGYLVQWLNYDSTSKIELEFLLGQGLVQYVSLRIRGDNLNLRTELCLQGAAALTFADEINECAFSVCTGPEEEGSEYPNELRLTWMENGMQTDTVIRYRWDLPTGNLWLKLVRGDQAGYAHGLLKEDRLRFEAAQVDSFIEMATGKQYGFRKCVLTLRPGAELCTPEYLAFSEWSMEDLILLLEGIGTLLGL